MKPVTPDQKPVVPVSTDTPATTPTPKTTTPIPTTNIKPKKNKTKGCIIASVVALLLLCCMVIVAIIGITTYYHIPGVSVVTEDITTSPGQQLNKRLDLYTDLFVYSLKKESGDKSTLSTLEQSQVDRAEEMMNSMNKMGMDINMDIVMEDAEYDLFDMDMKLVMHMDIDSSDENNPLIAGTASITEENMGANLILDIATTDDTAYIKLQNNATYPDLDLSSLTGTWYSIPSDDALELTSIYQNSVATSETVTEEDLYSLTDDNMVAIDNFKKILDHPTIIDNTLIVDGDDVDGQPTKCYMISLDNAQLIEIAEYASALYEEDFDKDAYTMLKHTNLTICFGEKDSIPYSIQLDMSLEEDTTSGSLQMGFSYYPDPDVVIEIPTNHTNYMEMDFMTLFPMTEESVTINENTDIYDDEPSIYKTCTFAPDSAGCASCGLFGIDEDICAYCEQMYIDFSYITNPEDRFDNYCRDLVLE